MNDSKKDKKGGLPFDPPAGWVIKDGVLVELGSFDYYGGPLPKEKPEIVPVQ